MAGKTVAKAAKVDGKKAAKPVADEKKVAVKKADGVKKPVAKKPNVGTKFNLHKLIMLIIRDAPKAKKGNKMTGGYNTTDTVIEKIKTDILTFIKNPKINIRIQNRIKEYYIPADGHAPDTIEKANKIGELLKNTNDTKVKSFIEYMNAGIGDEIIEIDKPVPKIDEPSNSYAYKEKRVYNVNLMIIVKALCQVYLNFNNYAEDIDVANKMKKKQISEMV